MAKRRGLRRWLIRLAIASIILLVVLAAALATRIPQESLTRFAISRILGVTAEVEWSSKWWTLRIDHLALFAPNESIPVIELRGLQPGWETADSKRFRKIGIDELVLRPHLYEDDTHNLQWLLDFLEEQNKKEKTPSTTDYLVVVRSLDVSGVGPDGEFEIQSFDAHAQFLGDGTSNVIVNGLRPESNVSVTYQDEKKSWTNPRVKVSAAPTDSSGQLFLDVRLDDEVKIESSVYWMESEAHGPHIVDVRTFHLASSAIPQLWKSDIGLEFDFDTLDIQPFEAKISQDFESLPDADLSVAISDLSLGPENRLLYSGDLKVQVSSQSEADRAEITATFPQEQHANINYAREKNGFAVDADLSEWSREQWMNVLPEEFREVFASLDMDAIDGSVSVKQGEGLEIFGELKARSESEEEPFVLAFEFAGDDSNWRGMTGWAESRMGEGRVRAEVGPEAGKLQGHVILEAVDAAPWVRWASGRDLPETLLARAAGTVTLSETDAGDFAIHPELKVFPLAFKTARFETVIISGDGSLTEDGSRITFPELKAEADDYTTVLTANDVLIDLKERSAKAAVALDFDVSMAGSLIDQPDWYGTGRLEWEGGIDSENVEGTIRFRSDYLGYGSIGVPYGRELFAEGTVNYDISDQIGSVPLVRATLGETNWEEIRDLRFALDPFRAEGSTEFSYDFALVAEMGFLKQNEEGTEGQIVGQADFSFEDEHATVEWSIQAESPRLELSTGIGSVRELNAQAVGRYVDGVFEGNGNLSAKSGTAAGAQLAGLTSTITFDEDKLLLPDLTGEVFNGRMDSRVEVAPLREGFPLWFDGKFRHIDLAILTTEVQPPKATLTGIGDASVTAAMLHRTLGNFTLQGSSNRDFTLNRTLVEEVLPLERMLSGLGQRQAERTLAKFLGEKPQRPFDSAEIDLNLVGRTIVGEAHLLSEKTRNYNGLNLHINMEIDVPALTEALKMLEEGEMP